MPTSDRTSSPSKCPRDGRPVHWDPVHGWLPLCARCLAYFVAQAYEEQKGAISNG